MSRFLKVMIVLLTIAAMAVPAIAGTVFEADGFKYNLDGDIQIQFRNNGADDDLYIDYDDLEIKNTATYQISDAMSVYGKFDFSGNGAAADRATGDAEDFIALEEAHVGISYNNFSFKYGSFDNTLDDFGVEANYEGSINGDAFDAAGVATGSGNSVEASATFAMVTVTVGHEMEVDTRDTDEFAFVSVSANVAGFGLTGAFADVGAGNGADEGDAYAISASYDFGVASVGADYSSFDSDTDANDFDAYNIVVKAPVGEKFKVAVGFNSEEEGTDDSLETFYINGTYALASGVNALVELVDSDYVDDIAYTAGLQVKF